MVSFHRRASRFALRLRTAPQPRLALRAAAAHRPTAAPRAHGLTFHGYAVIVQPRAWSRARVLLGDGSNGARVRLDRRGVLSALEPSARLPRRHAEDHRRRAARLLDRRRPAAGARV